MSRALPAAEICDLLSRHVVKALPGDPSVEDPAPPHEALSA